LAAHAALQQENRSYGDMLYLPVDANASGLQARVLSLYAWLQAAPLRYPHAFWICKADDDVYIVLPDWLSQLRMIESSRRVAALLARREPAEEAIVHGKILFHNMDAAAFTPKSFSFSFDSKGDQWQRAIRYAAGDASVSRDANERERLELCRKLGEPSCSEWCARREDCVGPFPYPAGWLFSLSSALARQLGGLPAVQDDVRRLETLARSWGPPVYEDIWLGAALHRWLPPAAHLTLVQLDPTHTFNGDWPGRCWRRMRQLKLETIRCDFEFNTSIVYHTGRRNDAKAVHAHLQRGHSRHVTPQPAIICSDDVPPSSKDSDRAALARGVSEYARFENTRRYFGSVSRTGSGGALGRPTAAVCAVVEPRFLVAPRWNRLFRYTHVNFLDPAERARFSTRGSGTGAAPAHQPYV
jgi:hypothetical protein